MRTLKLVVLLALLTGLAGGVAAWAASGPDQDPSPPAATRDVPGLVSLARPVAPVRLAGGTIDLRVREPGGRVRAVASFRETRTRTGRRVDRRCLAVGTERELRATRRFAGNCLDAASGQPWAISTGASSRGSVTLSGVVSERVERLILAGPGGTFVVPRSRGGAFVVVYGRRATGRAVLTATLADGSTRFFRTEVPPSFRPEGAAQAADPGGLAPWLVTAFLRERGPRAGQTCAQARQEVQVRSPRGGGGGSTEPACGDLRTAAVFARTVRTGRGAPGAFSPPGAPRRTVLLGAVSDAVASVAVEGPGGRRELPLAPAGRAFVAVFGERVEPAALTLEVTRTDGGVERYAAPVAVNRATSERPPPRLVGRPVLRLRGGRRVELRLTLDTIAARAEATLLGREVRLRRVGGGAGRRLYAGTSDGRRGARRALRAGAVQRFSLVLCGEVCSSQLQRARVLRGSAARAAAGESPESQGRKIAFRVVQATRREPGCRPARGGPRVVDDAPLPAVTTVLPLLQAPPDPAREDVIPANDGPLLRSTLHQRRLPGGVVVTTYVTRGWSADDPADGAACRELRLRRAEALLVGRSPAVRGWALRRLGELRDVLPGLQTLWLVVRGPGRRSGSGSGVPVQPGFAVRTGLSSSSGGGPGRRLYVGIAGPGVATVQVRSQRSGAARAVRVVDRLWAVTIARGAGRAKLLERNAAGRVLRVRRLR